MQFFTKELFSFLNDVEANNNRKWFEKNKQRYEEHVRGPALEFIAAMEKPLKKISPHFLCVPKKVGGSMMRIYRDTRFSKDKTPYKTNVGIHFRHELGKDIHAPGFYFHVAPDEIFVGAGIWHPDNTTLTQIRTAIDEDQPRWKKVTGGKSFRTNFERHGASLKRPPRGFDADHPYIDDLKMKDHVVLASLKKVDVMSKKLTTDITNVFKPTKPFMAFLCESLRLPF